MKRRSRRHSTGFGYIGFGNNQATFNQKTSTPFSVYKEKLDLEAHLHYEMHDRSARSFGKRHLDLTND